MFPDPDIQQAKLALLGLAGASGNLLGLYVRMPFLCISCSKVTVRVLAGLCMLANYRWFFRLMAIICIIFSILCVILLPYTGSTYKSHGDKTPRWKRMDIIGVLIAMGAAICFILGLTQGPIDGWGSTSFIAPFVLAFPLGVGFFVWGWSESRHKFYQS